ncbi:unknown [Firmicutes bacterium CAG:555]|nr:unknown [Firmicutes bacterium CAG:555]
MNFKNHIHTKIRNLFSSWLLPARRIHIEFIIESDKVPMPEVAKRIGIEQCEVRTTFPKNSIAKPYWQVDVKSNDISIEDPLRVLINLLEPKTGVIKEVLAELGETPVLSIYTESKWFDRPILELSHDVLQFFAQFDSDIIFDVNY